MPPRPVAPKGAFDKSKLRCATLLPALRAQELLGFSPALFERIVRADGETGVVCTHRSPLPAEAFSYQVVCGNGKKPPTSFERLRALHAGIGGARPGAGGAHELVSATSHLALHPFRPCFVQVTARAALTRPDLLAWLSGEIATRVP
jgi:hypothetical protein